MPHATVDRRTFLGVSAATVAVLSQHSTLAASSNETIRVGMIGPGGRGTALLNECLSFGSKYNARVTAVCDIWNLRRETAAKRIKDLDGSDPKVYRRVEEILDDQDIDAVIIATADHQHAKMLRMAVEAGKDVYCEKPMGNDLSETNAAFEAVQKSSRIVQIGTQRRSYPKYRSAAELMSQRPLGDVVKVDIIWNAYSPYRWAKSKVELDALKEKDVDWKAFLMGKPDRAFDPRIYRSFRLFRDFSSGIIDQWMTHGIDVVHMLTGEPYPTSAVAHGGIYQWRDYRENPDALQVSLEYGRGDNKFLANYSTNLMNEVGSATRLLGTHGTLQVEDVWRLSGDGSKRRDAVKQSQEIDDAPNTLHHMANWLDCIRRRDGEALYCPAAAGYGHSIACIMTTDALRSGRRMVFDPNRREIKTG